jgi:LysR family hydrogen peroxide-inducible transcriptional activator
LLACPRDHPAGHKGGPTWDTLDPDQRLLLEEGHCLREQALAACSGASRANRHATSLETLKYMVAAGEGCTLVPALAVAARDAVLYSPLPSTTYSRTIGLAWRRRDPRRAEFSNLVNKLKRIIHALDIKLPSRSNRTGIVRLIDCD